MVHLLHSRFVDLYARGSVQEFSTSRRVIVSRIFSSVGFVRHALRRSLYDSSVVFLRGFFLGEAAICAGAGKCSSLLYRVGRYFSSLYATSVSKVSPSLVYAIFRDYGNGAVVGVSVYRG